MEQIQRQVTSARRRLLLQRFLTRAPWWLFAALIVAAIALAIPKIWVLAADSRLWATNWLAGTVLTGLLFAVISTLWGRRGTIEAAIELDHRYGLKERVSSALSLSPDERDTDAGQALIGDATRRIEQVIVREQFKFKAGRHTLLPLVPAVLIFLMLTFPNAKPESLNAASDNAALRDRLKKSSQVLKKELEKRRKLGDPKEVEEADALFSKLQKGLDALAGDDKVDRKKALIKINDLAKEVENQRKALGDPQKMKQQLSQLKRIERGPAEKFAGALQEGNFQKALEQLKKLNDELKNGGMSKESKAQLSEQLKQMQQGLQDMVDDHKQAKRDLKRQIQQKMAAGDVESAAKLQRQLEQLEQQNKQMQRMQKMAQRLDEAQQSMAEGDAQEAASQLQQLADELSEMQGEMDTLESLDEVMDAISEAKEMMRGEMDGDAFSSLGRGMDQFSDMPGDGMQEGQGGGYRPEQETKTGEYDARQRAKPKAGEAVRIGDAFGPNRAGLSQEEIKDQIITALGQDSDPMTDQKLPRSQRDHVKQYYQRLND
jgi:hypothetical protein